MNRKVHVRFRGEVLEKCLTAEKLYGNSPALLPYALLNAIGRDETLLDPSVLFKQNTEQSAIYADDAAYWNVEVGTTAEDVPEPITASPEIADDPLLVLAVQLGAVVHRIADGSPISRLPPAARKQETALPSPKVDPILERMLFNTNNLQFDFLAAFEPRSDELKQSHNRQTDEPESSPTIPIPPLTVPQSRKPDVDPDRIARREVFPEPKPEQLALF